MNGWFGEPKCAMSSNFRFCVQEGLILPELSSAPGLTAGCLGPALLVLTGMELGPFREEVGVCVLLPLATAGGLLREEVGVVAVGVFFMKREKRIQSKRSDDKNDKTKGFDK